MIITPDNDQGLYKIKSYSPKTITINETEYTSSLILSSEEIFSPWEIKLQSLCINDFDLIFKLKPTTFILGTGEQTHFLSAEILHQFYQHKIGIECMTTAAACRTFNVLISERRNVMAGLILCNCS